MLSGVHFLEWGSNPTVSLCASHNHHETAKLFSYLKIYTTFFLNIANEIVYNI